MKKILLPLLVFALTLLLLQNPADAVLYAKNSLALCGNIILPSLFPFFVCSGLLIYSGFCESLARLLKPIMRPVFGIGGAGAAALILGLVSGYPLGAVTACRLYEKSYLTKTEAERLLAFCNNSGPLFLLGAVGVSLYASPKIGALLYLAHILSSLSVGVLFRFYRKNSFAPEVSAPHCTERNFGEIFSAALRDSVESILMVCGTVLFAGTVANLGADLLFSDAACHLFFLSLTEFVGGVTKISETALPLAQKLILSSGLVGFAGFGVHLQVLGVVARYHLNLFPYFCGKFLHALFSMLLTALFVRIFSPTVTVFCTDSLSLSGGFAIGSLFSVLSVCTLAIIALLCLLFKKTRKEKIA